MSHVFVIALLLPHVLAQVVTEESGAGVTPYLVGGSALVLLFGIMLALLAFGKGREHS